MEQIRFKSSDDLEVFGHLSMPKNKRISGLVLLISGGIHGGVKFEDGSYDPLHLEIVDYLNQRDFLTLLVDKRGSKGYGQEYQEKLDFCGKEVDDIIAGGMFLRSLPESKGKKISVHGTSRGATLAALVVSSSNLFDSAILSSGFYDIGKQCEYELAHRPEIAPTYQSMGNRKLSEFPHEELSPINMADKLECPVMIVHGQDDEVVLPEQSRRYFNRLRELGKQAILIEYPHFAHFKDYSLPSNPVGKKYWEDCVAFLKDIPEQS